MTIMMAPVFLLVAFLSLGKVHAQQCYKCLSFTSGSNISAFARMMPGYEPCDEDYKLMTFNCSAVGGCLKVNYNFEYRIEGQGRVNTELVVRDCRRPASPAASPASPAADVCESSSEQLIDGARQALFNDGLSTIQYVTGSGIECVCSGDLCNRAPATTLSLGALLASLLVSYIAMKH